MSPRPTRRDMTPEPVSNPRRLCEVLEHTYQVIDLSGISPTLFGLALTYIGLVDQVQACTDAVPQAVYKAVGGCLALHTAP